MTSNGVISLTLHYFS